MNAYNKEKKLETLDLNISNSTVKQEEMIAGYRKTIDEAKKDPETLAYVRENFDEVFGDQKKEWQDTGSQKREAINSKNETDEFIAKEDPQSQELQPKKTAEEMKALNDTFKNFFKDDLRTITALGFGLNALDQESNINEFIEKNNLTKNEFYKMRKDIIVSSIDESLSERYNRIDFDENMNYPSESHDPTETIYIDRIKPQIEYEMAFPELKEKANKSFESFKQKYADLQNKFVEVLTSNNELSGLLVAYGFKNFDNFTNYLNPNSLKEMLEDREPQGLIDSMDKIDDLDNLFDSLVQDYTNLKGNNGGLSLDKLGDYLKEKEFINITLSPNRVGGVPNNTIPPRLKQKYSNNEILEIIAKQEQLIEKDKAELLKKYEEVLK